MYTGLKPKLLILAVTIFGSVQAQDAFELSREFYDAVKANNKSLADQKAEALANISQDVLDNQLNTENKKKAFWVNMYNIYVQYLLVNDPSLFDDRDDFFTDDLITIAGQKVSFDIIEHGIIRRSKNKLSMGYVGKVFVDEYEKRFRLEEVDYRVHFALNCGAKSCPPVAFYDHKKIDEQLDKSSKRYLKSTVRYDKEENDVHVPVLAMWFKADFDGEEGIMKMLRKYGFGDIVNKDPSIEYLDYDWTLLTGNYINLND